MKRRLMFVGLGASLAILGLATPALAQEVTAEAVQTTLDNIWVLIAAVLVIFMQAGFALVSAA
ncbi:MAG: ammonium transporter, partial [Acidimicrobiia bacterium]|nr:ammonium transporter [Acidimicrobiia bacterium]